jgi:hypothetical protein
MLDWEDVLSKLESMTLAIRSHVDHTERSSQAVVTLIFMTGYVHGRLATPKYEDALIELLRDCEDAMHETQTDQ